MHRHLPPGHKTASHSERTLLAFAAGYYLGLGIVIFHTALPQGLPDSHLTDLNINLPHEVYSLVFPGIKTDQYRCHHHLALNCHQIALTRHINTTSRLRYISSYLDFIGDLMMYLPTVIEQNEESLNVFARNWNRRNLCQFSTLLN